MIQETKTYQAYYTESTPIVDYMVSMLQLKSTDKVFEPCGGEGVFVEAIVEDHEFIDIDVCELNEKSVKTLKDKFVHYPNVQIRQCDTLLDNDLIFNSNFGGVYDKIIANPPYGAWQDYDKRVILRNCFQIFMLKKLILYFFIDVSSF